MAVTILATLDGMNGVEIGALMVKGIVGAENRMKLSRL